MENTTLSTPKPNYWLFTLLGGILFTLFGIWVLVSPGDSFNTLIVGFGIITMLIGLTEAVLVIHPKSAFKGNFVMLIEGVFDLVMGFLLAVYPEIILNIVSYIVGAFLIYRGGANLFEAFKVKSADAEKFKLKLVFGFLLIALAAALIWHPEIIGLTLGFWIGLGLLAFGIFRIGLALKLKKN